MHHNIRHQDQATQDSILSTLDAKKKRAFRCLIDEFRDALAMRCQCHLLRMPATCDGCVAAFNLEHALDCKIGGLVTQRHNEIRDALGDLASIAFKNGIKEPMVKEADISIRCLWQPQTVALLDVRVVDTDAPSHRCTITHAYIITQMQYFPQRKKKRSTSSIFYPFCCFH
ncbi:hypothetical protein EMCRGX_G017917 [Ephydatia muelleri]